MPFDRLCQLRRYALGTCLAVTLGTGLARAGEEAADLRNLAEQQQQQIEELRQRIAAREAARAAEAAEAADDKDAPKDAGRVVIDPASVNKIIADYLKDNPGAGMPPGVQTGYSTATGFAIRSPNNPPYVNWQDESKIPFEMRIRGRIQIPYYYYKVTDDFDHQRNRLTYPTATASSGNGGLTAANNPWGVPGANSTGDFSILELKRTRLIFEGSVFDPNLRYQIQLDGPTRGLDGLSGGSGIQGIPGPNSNGGLSAVTQSNGNAIAQVDHAVRIYGAYVAYDFHPCCASKGCGEDCPEGTYKYAPTLTLIAGKLKPFFAFEEMLSSFNSHFVEHSMTEFFFDADDDNLLNWWGLQYKGMEDRLYAAVGITNGSESQFAARQMDDLPGFNAGLWYDFGGTWNAQRHAWDLYGDTVGDVDYSCKPVLRVGVATNIVWADRRSIYTNAELQRIRVSAVQPGGGNSSFINILNGGTIAGATPVNTNGTPDTVDKFDTYSYEAFAAFKWRGFSLFNDWFFRDIDDFKGTKRTGGADNPIIYQANLPATGINNGVNALFTRGGVYDMGTQIQVGYFLVPKKLEVCGKWSWIHGQSGTLNGDGTSRPGPTILVGATPVPTVIVNNAFREWHDSNEYAIGMNYFWRRTLLKWQTDLAYYQGGNPAAGGQSLAGFIPGVDGWMLRTQIQIGF
jgi:hypothetical protein